MIFNYQSAFTPLFIISVLLIFCKDRTTAIYKTDLIETYQKLDKQKLKLINKNRYVATLTHEMRNIVTRYFIIFII